MLVIAPVVEGCKCMARNVYDGANASCACGYTCESSRVLLNGLVYTNKAIAYALTRVPGECLPKECACSSPRSPSAYRPIHLLL